MKPKVVELAWGTCSALSGVLGVHGALLSIGDDLPASVALIVMSINCFYVFGKIWRK